LRGQPNRGFKTPDHSGWHQPSLVYFFQYTKDAVTHAFGLGGGVLSRAMPKSIAPFSVITVLNSQLPREILVALEA